MRVLLCIEVYFEEYFVLIIINLSVHEDIKGV